MTTLKPTPVSPHPAKAGQDHDSRLWTDPHRFDPRRFLDRAIGARDLVPQGAGDPHTGHRCPGEPCPRSGVRLAARQT
ncbi:hypothetical protein UK23_22240 [Lentzea aerocolonigenes]|uniref:Uncharacterized protein n=1 Tax=Lentzea aerocolonigenes TaxID=68170 RepID=A0A0F0GZF1_LENAE|nr:hypothetical protein [Lentzea aerocolonigenes]KJK46813.1 hypothetical protein UK23_22240 [Lentzea aerocolonigenes]